MENMDYSSRLKALAIDNLQKRGMWPYFHSQSFICTYWHEPFWIFYIE